MKWLPLLLLLVGCSRQPQVVYRVPPEKQEAVAELVAKLVNAHSWGYAPDTVYQSALRTAQQVYGEPVKP